MNFEEELANSNVMPRSSYVQFYGSFPASNNPDDQIDRWRTYACYANLSTGPLKTHFKYKSMIPNWDAQEYFRDLKKEFEENIPGVQMEWKDGEGYTKIDPEVISGPVLFGVLSWARHMHENPEYVLGYKVLKDKHPELNFYQKLVGGVVLGKNNSSHGSAIVRTSFVHLKGLSFEALKDSWKQYKLVPFTQRRKFQPETTGALVFGQSFWLPKPWGTGEQYYGLKPLPYINYCKDAVEFLLNDDPFKVWK